MSHAALFAAHEVRARADVIDASARTCRYAGVRIYRITFDLVDG